MSSEAWVLVTEIANGYILEHWQSCYKHFYPTLDALLSAIKEALK